MYIYLEDEDGPLIHGVKIEECDFSGSHVTLPVLPNYEDTSEEAVVQLWYIVKKYVCFIEDLSHGHSKLETLPYCVIAKLNRQAGMLIEYFNGMGCMKFRPKIGWQDTDPAGTTPYCQYFYDSCKQLLFDIEEYLHSKGLKIQDFKGLKKLFDNQVQL